MSLSKQEFTELPDQVDPSNTGHNSSLEPQHSEDHTSSVEEARNVKPEASDKITQIVAPKKGNNNTDVEKAQPSEYDKPYTSFSKKQKILIVLCATLGGLFSPFTTNIYFPAISTIASDLHVSVSKINLTITTYMIFQGIAPSFISSITDAHGRRPTYVIGFIMYIAANIGLALNNSYPGLLVLRCIQSAGSSGLVTLAHATITDVVTSAERGSYIGITSIASVVAPSVAPIVGGALSQYLGWHSIFWMLVIMSGVYLVPLLLWFPETSRKVVGDGSLPPPKWNKSLLNIIREKKGKEKTKPMADERVVQEKKPFPWPNPMKTLAVFRDLEMVIILFFAANAYAAFYAINTSLTVQFHDIYGLNDTMQGLLFIPQAVGSILSAVTNSILLDKNYARHAKKLGFEPGKKKQHDLRNFPIERARMEITLPMFTVNSICMIVYGWMLEYKVHIAGPIVMLVFIGYTTMAGFNSLGVLNMDLNRHRASSASAAANLSRCLLGAGMTAAVNPMIEAMGRGWCFTFTALVQFSLLPILGFFIKNGVKWRAKRPLGASA